MKSLQTQLTHGIAGAVFILLAASALCAEPATSDDFQVFRDDEFRLTVACPKSWKKIATADAQSRIRVISEEGLGGDDLHVTVLSNDMFRKLTPSDYVKRVSTPQMTDGLVKGLQQKFATAKLVSSGKMRLSDQDAFFFTCDVTLKGAPDFVMRQIQVSTLKGGTVYYVTCRTGRDDFDKRMPLFKRIIDRFTFTR